jgi:uncharacterized membrane protein YhaH (DUF805 family)
MVRRRSTVRFRKGAPLTSRRRYWLTPAAALLVVSAYGFLHFAIKTISFENTNDAVYTAWVYQPYIAAFGLTSALGVVVCVLLVMRRWRPVTRTSMLASVAVFAVVSILFFGHSSSARRQITPALLRAVQQVPAPPGATEVGAASVSTDRDEMEVLQEPQASRTWRTATGSKADACAGIRAQVGGDRRWHRSPGACGYSRGSGMVDVFLDAALEGPDFRHWLVTVSAAPRMR